MPPDLSDVRQVTVRQVQEEQDGVRGLRVVLWEMGAISYASSKPRMRSKSGWSLARFFRAADSREVARFAASLT
jgi:hypothetical protein